MSTDVHTRETPPRPTPKSSTPVLATLPHGSGRRSHPGPLAALQALVADTGTVWVEGREPARAELETAFDLAALGLKREEGG